MVESPRVGVLALQGGVVEHLAFLREVGTEPVRVRKVEELEGLDGIVIPGGESTTISKLLVSTGIFDPLRELIQSGLPTWGTCAGMILLADSIVGGTPDQRTLGAIDAVVRRNAFGSQAHSHEEELKVEGLDASVHAVFIRAPIFESVGDQVEVLARSGRPGSDHPIVAVSQGRVLATSFHPELSDESTMHGYFVDRFVRQ